MNTKNRQIATILLLFLCLINTRVNAQELIKAEKEWLIDYYFKDDTAFANRLTKVAYFQAHSDFSESAKILSDFKVKKTDSLKQIIVSYYKTIQYSFLDDKRAYSSIDSIYKTYPNIKIKCPRYHIGFQKFKLMCAFDTFRIKEDKSHLQLRFLNLMRFAIEQKDYYGFLNLCRFYPWIADTRAKPNCLFSINFLCLKIADLINNKLVKTKIYDDLAFFNFCKGDLEGYYRYNFLALKLNEEIENRTGMIRSYNLYAHQNFALGDYEAANKYKAKIILYLAKKNDISSLCEHLTEYANYLKADGKKEKSIKMDHLAFRLSGLQNNVFKKVICKNGYYRNILLDSEKLNQEEILQLKKYFFYTDSVLNNSENTIDHKFSLDFNYLTNYSKFLQLTGHYKESADTSVALSKIFFGPMVGSDEILYNYKIIYDDYKKLGDYKNANIYLEKYYHHIDSVKSQLKIQNIVRNEIEYEADKINKKEEIEKAKEKERFLVKATHNKNIQTITQISIAFLIILLCFGLYLYFQKAKSEKKLSLLNNELYIKNTEIKNTLEYTHKMEKDIILQKNETQNKENEFQLAQAELKALRSQMNPHFLFNAINSIQSYMLKNDSLLASKYLTKFARLIRSVLENSKQEFVPLSIEISTLELYVELEAMRSSFEFDYEFVLEDGMISSNYLIPPMIIQPYVENAILHGITQLTDRRGQLTVLFSIQNQILKCVVDDNGIGRKEALEIKAAKDINRKSIGLEVTNNRIEILNKHNKMFAQVNIIDKFDNAKNAIGTKVEIEITLNKAV